MHTVPVRQDVLHMYTGNMCCQGRGEKRIPGHLLTCRSRSASSPACRRRAACANNIVGTAEVQAYRVRELKNIENGADMQCRSRAKSVQAKAYPGNNHPTPLLNPPAHSEQTVPPPTGLPGASRRTRGRGRGRNQRRWRAAAGGTADLAQRTGSRTHCTSCVLHPRVTHKHRGGRAVLSGSS